MPDKLTGKAGFIKITSRDSANPAERPDSQEFDLVERIYQAKESGNKEEALRLIDVLIEMYSASGRPVFELLVDKVWVQDPGNFKALIPIYEDQLDFYRKGDNLIEQIKTLHSLAAVSVNSEQFPMAMAYIQRAEILLEKLQNENAQQGLAPAAITELRNRILQAKIYIVSRLENR